MKSLIKTILIVVFLIYSLSVITYIACNTARLGYQQDFRVYYFSAKVLSVGDNPYDPSVLCPVAKTSLYCAYPPFTLFFYKMFLPLAFPAAANVFIFLKVALLVVLVFFWKKYFLEERCGVLFCIFCLLAFNRTIYVDLIAGNVSLIEQFFLWISFHFFLKNRLFLFGIFVLLSSFFKLTPIGFLFLLLLTAHPKRILYFSIFLFSFLLYIFAQAAFMPQLFANFLSNAILTTSERGAINPSTFALIQDIFYFINAKTRMGISPWVPKGAALIFDLAVIGAFVCGFQKIKLSNIKDKEKIILFLFCLLYALVHPRFKDYSHILLIVPTYFILIRPLPVKAIYVFFVLFLVSFTFFLPGEKFLFNVFSEYYSLILVYFTCGLYYWSIFRVSDRISESREAIKNSSD